MTTNKILDMGFSEFVNTYLKGERKWRRSHLEAGSFWQPTIRRAISHPSGIRSICGVGTVLEAAVVDKLESLGIATAQRKEQLEIAEMREHSNEEKRRRKIAALEAEIYRHEKKIKWIQAKIQLAQEKKAVLEGSK